MKKLICLLLTFCLLCGPALADGDPNVDGGGGDSGSGSGSAAWNPGDDGVRVTILQGTTPISILDYSNVQRSRTQQSFKTQCKLFYKNGGQLVPRFDQYTNIVPAVSLPRIVSSNGTSTIEALRNYFTDRTVLVNLADDAGLPFENLISGDYKLMLEPIAFFKYDNVQYAMTATEAALFDTKVGGDLKYWMGTLTHQNLPLAMFLERPDVGIQPWGGASSGRRSNIDIINYLGVGIVTFRPEEEVEPPELGDYVYRTDTDVITAAYVYNNRTSDITPDDNRYISFGILGRSYSVAYVCPGGAGQLVWVRWHTPSTPQDFDITVSDGSVISVSVVDVPDVEPPDPDFYDTNPGFRPEEAPGWGKCKSTTWSEWIPEWHPPVMMGPILIPGYWTFDKADYSASLDVEFRLTPDERVRTDVRYSSGYEMKSGYGVTADCTVNVYGSGGVLNRDVTPVQNVVAVFPEFGFRSYDRLLTPARADAFRTTWSFKPNKYSYYNNPTHFTPLWYPDDEDYTVPVAVFDAWTPGGMLYATVSDSVHIDGSVFDDWYIRVTESG